jgi:hypothetical protein
MAATDLKAFLGIAVGSLLLLSLGWLWVGIAYNALLVRTVTLLIPATVTLEQHGHNIKLAVPLSQNSSAATEVIYNMAISAGLIVAISILLAVPRIKPRERLLLVFSGVLITFVSHVAGFYVLVQRLQFMSRHPTTPGALIPMVLSLGEQMTLVWPVAPSLLWLVVLLRQGSPLRLGNG